MLNYISALIILAIVLVAHIAGIDGLYYTYGWYDIMMHMLGGIGIGFFIAGLLKSYRNGALFKRGDIITAVFVAGVAWEVLEIWAGISGNPPGTMLYYIDTIKDLIDDTIGGALVAYIVIRKK